MSAVDKFVDCKPYFQLFSTLNKSEVQNILKTLKKKKKLISCFAEFAFNYCVLGARSNLSDSEKKTLRKFKNAIFILVDKKQSLQTRNQALGTNPQLVKTLSYLILAALWPSQ